MGHQLSRSYLLGQSANPAQVKRFCPLPGRAAACVTDTWGVPRACSPVRFRLRLTCSRDTFPRSIRSDRRPGVATSMSQPRSMSLSCSSTVKT